MEAAPAQRNEQTPGGRRNRPPTGTDTIENPPAIDEAAIKTEQAALLSRIRQTRAAAGLEVAGNSPKAANDEHANAAHGSGGHHESKLVGWGKTIFAIFGVFGTWIWRAIKAAPSMAGGGGGHGGGHAPKKASGGHSGGGGGHH